MKYFQLVMTRNVFPYLNRQSFLDMIQILPPANFFMYDCRRLQDKSGITNYRSPSERYSKLLRRKVFGAAFVLAFPYQT